MDLIRRSGRARRRLGAFSAGVALMAVAAGPAHATTTTAAATSCSPTVTSEPFAAWGDVNAYTLVPGSDFSSSTAGAGWTLTGGAKIVSAKLPWDPTGVASTDALSIPFGATAQSPFFCLDSTEPTFRFFAGVSGPQTNVDVSLVFVGSNGVQVVVPGGGAQALSQLGWEPSPTLLTQAQVAELLNGGAVQLALRFSSTNVGVSGLVDDVFVDPRAHG